MIDLFCQGCGHHLRIPNKYAGTQGKCKYCNQHFDVPMEIIETPSDLDSNVPGSGRDKHAEGIGVPGLDVEDSGGFSFEDVMSDKGVGSGGSPPPMLDNPIDDPMGIDDLSANFQGVAQFDDPPLGCLFWGVVFFIPPAGLVWAILSPSDHAERGKGIIASVVMLMIAIGTLAASFALASSMDVDWTGMSGIVDSGFDEGSYESEEGAGGLEFFPPRKTATVIMEGVRVPAVRDIRFVQSPPITLTVGPFVSMDSRNLRCYLASVDGVDYLQLQSEYQTALNDAGWEYEFIAGYDSNVGMYTDMYGFAQGNQVHLRIVENDSGMIVYFITRPD